jgi:hypothetical protein
MNLIQIVPGIFPQIDGIGDHALKLAQQLRARHGILTTFVVCDPGWKGNPEHDGFPIVCVTQRTSGALLKTLAGCDMENTPILVHFSVYGYQKRGCPFWFITAMEQYANQYPGMLHAYYHELSVTGAKPWSSAFWVPPIQRSLILRLAKVASGRYTHTEAHRRKLEDWNSGRVSLIELFSSFHEPVAFPSRKRNNDLVVFGRAWQRMHTYTTGKKALEMLCACLGIERIIDIGPPIEGHTEATIGGTPVLRCGRLDAHEIDEWMATSIGNFNVYPIALITKSSVFQIASANGNITFLFDDSQQEFSCPGLEAGVDYIPVTTEASVLALPPLNELGEEVYRNYQRRASWFAADKWAKHLFPARTR